MYSSLGYYFFLIRVNNKNQESIDFLSDKEFKNQFNILISAPIDGLIALGKEKTKTLTLWDEREIRYNNAIDNARYIYIKIRRILGEAAPHNEKLDSDKEDG